MKVTIMKNQIPPFMVLAAWLCTQMTSLACYNPSTGRWLSRDPATELEGAHLYSLIHNDALDAADYLGLAEAGAPAAGQSAGWPYPYPPLPGQTYPPPLPWDPQKMYNDYDYSCCTAQKIQDGLDTLIRRFKIATGYMASLGVEASPYGTGNGKVSCWLASMTILQFIEPTPPCWTCILHRRSNPATGWDENFIHCFTINGINAQTEAILDWYDGQTYKDSGVYLNVNTYNKRHPKPESPRPCVPRFRDCTQKSKVDWDASKLWYLLDRLVTSGKQPPAK